MSVAIHCGMPSELSILRRRFPNVPVFSGEDKLHLDDLVSLDCTWIIGMGLCGGTAPGFAVPDIVLANSIVDKAGDTFSPSAERNAALAARLTAAGIHFSMANVYYSSGLQHEADDVPERAALFAKYGAQAIDDELRYTVALAQKWPNLLLSVCRAISDDWRDNLPLIARGKVMNVDGSPNFAYIASAIGQDPSAGEEAQVAESVLTVVRHYNQSLDSLDAAARALAPLIQSS